MEPTTGKQVIYESCDKITRLLQASDRGGGMPDKAKPYSEQELLDLLPAIEAEAMEVGKACERMRRRLTRALGQEPIVNPEREATE